MRNAKSLFCAVTAVSVALLLLGIGTPQTKADKPDPHKPVHATDVVLAKKITLKGGHGPGAGGPKKVETATGQLGLPWSGTKRAIVVGISDYPGTANDLEYGDDDAEAMTHVLTTVYGFTDVTTITNTSALRSVIMNEIDALRVRTQSNDEVVFFFSGHGMNGIADDGDAEKRDEAICAHDGSQIVPIWDGELKQAFESFLTDRIIFIFDSCLAGGMDDLQEPGRVILMACGETGYSYEGDQWGHGEFTYYLVLKGIDAGLANIHDYDLDTVLSESDQVTAEEAFDYAKANCRYDRPVIDDSFTNDLLP